MIKKVIWIALILIANNVHGQSYLNPVQMNVFVNINNYTYVGDRYIGYNPYPDYSMYDAMRGMLQTLQARYDYAHSILSAEYSKMNELQLVNAGNVFELDVWKQTRKEWIDANIKKVDLSIYDNFSNIYNYITGIYTIPSVKAEIQLLKSINGEIGRLRFKHPDDFYKSDRYKELGDVLGQLRTIDRDSIGTLSWKYGLL